jgi:hypothetical protein
VNHYPKKAAQQQPAPNALVRQNAMQQGGNNRGQPRAQYGKVNHLEADTVQETPGVALGTFLVEYHSANVLFDTGATHSFVTASWVETHNIPVTAMYPPMRVVHHPQRRQLAGPHCRRLVLSRPSSMEPLLFYRFSRTSPSSENTPISCLARQNMHTVLFTS